MAVRSGIVGSGFAGGAADRTGYDTLEAGLPVAPEQPDTVLPGRSLPVARRIGRDTILRGGVCWKRGIGRDAAPSAQRMPAAADRPGHGAIGARARSADRADWARFDTMERGLPAAKHGLGLRHRGGGVCRPRRIGRDAMPSRRGADGDGSGGMPYPRGVICQSRRSGRGAGGAPRPQRGPPPPRLAVRRRP
jgi:hypothetical protein